eukprot:458900_1
MLALILHFIGLHFIVTLNAFNTSIPKIFLKYDGIYLNPNGLNQNNAEKFCNTHCNSHLLSIHTQKDFLDIKSLITNSYDYNHLSSDSIWFGLNQNEYTDNSDFDWGTNKSIYPWYQSINGSISEWNCTHLSEIRNYKWIDEQCDTKQRFICDECIWNEFSKYILIDDNKYNFSQGNSYCQAQFHTNLASIHNEEEYKEAQLLCSLSNDSNCWIGLKNNIWIDGTEFIYGNVNNSENCSVIRAENTSTTWLSDNCEEQKSFICNMPSELCFKSQWNNVTGIWNWNGCEVHNENNISIDLITLDLSHGDLWKKVIIEYTFAVYNVLGNESMSGIVFNIYDYDRHSYNIYIAINYYDNTVVVMYNDTVLATQSIDTPQLNVFYSLKITFNRFGYFHISLNGNDKNSFYIYDISLFPLNYYINSISLQNKWISTHSKSFFING